MEVSFKQGDIEVTLKATPEQLKAIKKGLQHFLDQDEDEECEEEGTPEYEAQQQRSFEFNTCRKFAQAIDENVKLPLEARKKSYRR